MRTSGKINGPLAVLTSLAALSLAQSSQLPSVLASLPTEELLDIDCLEVRSLHVDWGSLRRHVWQFDAIWQAPLPQLLLQSCRKVLPSNAWTDEHVILRRVQDAFAECALGTLSAVLLVSLCTADCSGKTGSTFSIFDDLWRALLLGPNAVPVYMLGTSAWPIASLLAKWQAFCASHSSRPTVEPLLCQQKEVTQFLARAEEAAGEHLMPLLWQPREKAGAAEALLGMFVATTLRPLTTFMNSGPHAEPDFAATCAPVMCAEAATLLLIRLLGPPVSRDPLHRPRLWELTSCVAKTSFLNLTDIPVVFPAVLAVTQYVAWRSHDTFLDVKHSELREVLHGAWTGATACQSGCNLLHHFQNQGRGGLQKLWEAASSNSNLSPLWKQIAGWLMSLKHTKAAPVYVAGGCGAIHERWLTYFLNRAADLRLLQVIFITAEIEWLLKCEDVREGRNMTGLLCIRIGHEYIKPLDLHDKAKFYLFPVLLSLGMDIVSLDLDVYLFKDPTARLLDAVHQEQTPLDIAVMDYFDGTCLNAGVIVVRASDNALLWVLQYIKWMHTYPFGHYQNGLDAFLKHSVVEPQMPEFLTNVSYGILAADLEYVTLAGWSGSMHKQRHRALLLHFSSATSTGLTHMEKQAQLLNLFNATARRTGEKEPDLRRMQMAKWKVLSRLKTSSQRWKTPCYVGVHSTVAQLIETGLYQELLS